MIIGQNRNFIILECFFATHLSHRLSLTVLGVEVHGLEELLFLLDEAGLAEDLCLGFVEGHLRGDVQLEVTQTIAVVHSYLFELLNS